MQEYSNLGMALSKAKSQSSLRHSDSLASTNDDLDLDDDDGDELTGDLTMLPNITNESVLSNLKERYYKEIIFTAFGNILVSMKPSRSEQFYGKEYHRQYEFTSSNSIPHVYLTTLRAYRQLVHTSQHQTVVITGETGSGKSEIRKHVIDHVIYLAERKGGYSGVDCGDKRNLKVKDQIEACNYVLESLCNDRTDQNYNSSRFSRLWELYLTSEGHISGANIRVILFEEFRLLSIRPHHDVFQILYYLVAGLPQNQKHRYNIHQQEDYSFFFNIRDSTTQSTHLMTNSHRRLKMFTESLSVIGFNNQEVSRILLILSAILNLLHTVHKGNEYLDQSDQNTIIEVCDVLSLEPRMFFEILSRQTNYSEKPGIYPRTAPLRTLVILLYISLLDGIIQRANKSLQTESPKQFHGRFSVLEMTGFENHNINGFEQLSINAANERLHQVFLSSIFLSELSDFTKEGYNITNDLVPDNHAVVDLLFKPRRGVFHTINSVSENPESDESTLYHTLDMKLSISSKFRASKEQRNSFIIRHTAGEVKYDCHGMLERNRDKLWSNLFEYVCTSPDTILVQILTCGLTFDSASSSECNQSRTSSRYQSRDNLQFKKTAHRESSILKDRRGKSYSQYLCKSIEHVIQSIASSKHWYIKCIRPNRQSEPGLFDENAVMEQIEGSHLTKAAEMQKQGYSVRMHPEEFLHRFRDISFLYGDVIQPSSDNCEQVLKDAGIQDYIITTNKVFLKHWHEPYLQELVTAIHVENNDGRTDSIPPSQMSSAHTGYTDKTNAHPDGDSGRRSFEDTVPRNPVENNTDSDITFNQSSETNEKTKQDNSKTQLSSYFVSEWMKDQDKLPSEQTTTRLEFKWKEDLDQQVKTLSQKKSLDPRWWDRFQMMPREHVSSSATFTRMFKFFKVLCYLLLFVLVLVSAVVNKICVLLMTSSITNDPLPENQWPVKTMVIISICFPYSIWFLTYSAKTMFGSNTWPPFSLISVTLLYEFLHTLGLCLLVFRVLPMLDMLRGFIVLGSIYTIPAFLKTVFEGREPSYAFTRKCVMFVLNFGALLIQIGSIVACAFFNITMSADDKDSLREKVITGQNDVVVERQTVAMGTGLSLMWEVPVSLLLISTTYWETFVDGDLSIFGYTLTFKKWKKHLHHARSRLYLFASVWKALWVIAFAVLMQPGFNFNMMFTAPTEPQLSLNTTTATLDTNSNHETTVNASNVTSTSIPKINTFELHPEVLKHFELYGVLYIQIIANVILTYFAGAACKMCMQIVGFSLPLILTTPVSIAIVILQCKFRFLSTGNLVWIGVESDPDLWIVYLSWLCVLWISEIYVNSHIWYPSNGRMEKIDRLFVTPLRCGIFTDQSLMLRRRRHDQDLHLFLDDENSTVSVETEFHKGDDVVPQIYACATMWHETRAEMTNLLKSIFRMDIDHSGRYLAQKFYQIRDPDYYEFEAHIFFDDAMELSDDDQLVPNMFVTDLIECIDDSLSSVHERQMSLGDPTRTPTPYGGRLTWQLPGGSKLIVHLKDKHKIRHKKRWSQVMYMYYLLGYRILAQPENLIKKNSTDKNDLNTEFQRVKLTEAQLRRRRKAAHFTRSVIFNYVTDEVHTQAENTYILTLDGDVDFHPDAVRLLLDRMKTNKKVGAACGRIHPVGSGPLVWYQQFEYAIGHWLQKATEHVFGCVMCAPGCFSLFRGSALMDDNVARTYATRATEATHYVQYDQGEDRWLSTLLLQQGYRIDYCAAADALTQAPETFSEFFNQRRRWGPSTLANVVDLLGSWKGTIKINDNISTFYILYLFCMMVSTVLGPATILLMMAGAFTVVFKTGVLASYALALIPAIIFILICVLGKPNTQMTIATIMSAVYAIVMTIVLVATVGQAIEGGFTSPNVIFLIMLIVIFLVSAVFHPAEFFCIIPGALYFVCLPTGYLLLPIYFLCNMNTVSWGTREVPKRKSKEEIAQEKILEEEKRKKKDERRKGIFGWIGLSSIFRDFGEVVRQLKSDTKQSKSRTDILLEELIIELRSSRLQETRPAITTSSATMTGESNDNVKLTTDTQEEVDESKENNKIIDISREWVIREDPNWPAWLQSTVCGDGPIKELPDKESIFWHQIIGKYLHPITEDRSHQEKVTDDLKNLRNNVVFGFFMTSALWVALAIELQVLQEELKDTMFFKIPKLGYDENLAFEPLGLFFLVFFATILCIQFIGMFAHRWGTVLHMLSITEVSCGRTTFTEKDKIRDIISKAMELQKLCNIENEPEPDYEEPLPDYEFSEDEDTIDTVSVVTGASLPLSSVSLNPPSYHSATPTAPLRKRRKGKEIFRRNGVSTGAALRRAFEKRFRNENLGQSGYEVNEEEMSPRLQEQRESVDTGHNSLVSRC